MTIKKMLLIIWAFMIIGAVSGIANSAETVNESGVIIEPLGLDLSSVFSKTRAGTMFVFVPKGMTLATVYAPVVSYHVADMELLNLNAGAALNVDDATKGSPYFALGFRLDNILTKAVSGTWAKEHLTAAKLPSMELSLAGTWYSPEHIWCGGVALAVKFGN
jgi:hypothetical protein